MAYILYSTNFLPDQQLGIPWDDPQAAQMVQKSTSKHLNFCGL